MAEVKNAFIKSKMNKDLDSRLLPSGEYRNALNDKYLALYIALDLYYSKLFDIDFSKVNLDKPEQKVDFNKVPKAP